MEYIEVASLTDLPNHSRKIVDIGGKLVVLFNTDGDITAIGNSCLHKGGSIGEGELEKRESGIYAVCPWHGWHYNIKTGAGLPEYDIQQTVYEVKIQDGKILVGKDPIKKAKSHSLPKELNDLAKLEYQTTKTSLNILGISTTNMSKWLPRPSTSEMALQCALDHAQKNFGANIKLTKLRELKFSACEGYYSRHEEACIWPCTITEFDPKDGLTPIYRDLVLWADIVLVATPIRWGNASSLYYKMIERFNCIQNQTTLSDRVLIKNKVAGFIVTGGQDNVQKVASDMMVFFTQLGFALPPFSFMGWSRGWTAEDTENNISEFQKSEYIERSIHDLTDNCVKLLKQIKTAPNSEIESPQPKISELSN